MVVEALKHLIIKLKGISLYCIMNIVLLVLLLTTVILCRSQSHFFGGVGCKRKHVVYSYNQT